MASEKVTWMDLAGPIVNSSLSLVILLVLVSVLLAFSISGSIARPIERITEETARVGIGEWKPITVDATAGEVERLAVAFNNMIQNLKKREVELKDANNKLIQSESLAAVGRIGAGIAHEVKNPLASILSYGQLLEMNIKNFEKSSPELSDKFEKIKNYNKMIMDDTRRASKIISDLLTFARQKEVQFSKINIKKFLMESEGKLKAFCEQNGITFQSDFSGIPDSTEAQIDSDQIYQVLFNLVQNASHALKDQSNEKKIKLSASIISQKLHIAVADNGQGIAEENLSKIFEPFFSTKGIGEGSGLGLAICYGILQKHSGQITVQSKLNSGTTFEMILPVAA
jgi:two-component system NtrC family sensor kinase